MTPTISSAARKRLALVAFASLWLSACGGGGGGSETVAAAPPSQSGATGTPTAAPPPGTAAPSPSASGPAASPAPAPTPSASGPAVSPAPAPAPSGGTATPFPAPAVFQAWGPLIVDTGVTPSSPNSVARLSTGASVVAWMKGGALQAQLLDASGAKVGTPLQIVSSGLAAPLAFSIAPLRDGQWIATWAGTTPGSGPAILFQRFTAAGEAIGGPTQVAGGYASIYPALAAHVTSDGGVVIGWAARSGSVQAPAAAYVARFAPDGASMGGPVPVSTMASEQDSVAVSPLSDGTVLVTWLQGDAVTQLPSGYSRAFDAAGQPSGPERQILGVTFESNLAAAPLGGNKVAVAGSRGTSVVWEVLDASGTPLGDAVSLNGTGEMTGAAIVDAGGGSFQVLYQNADQTPISNTSTISVQRVDSTGAPDGTPSELVRRRLGIGSFVPEASPIFSASGGTDGHYILSYEVSGDTSVEVDALAK